MKNGGRNLSIMIIVFKQIVSCEKLGILTSFGAICFDHALFMRM